MPGIEGGEVGLQRGDAMRRHELRHRAGEGFRARGGGERGEGAHQHEAGSHRCTELGGELARRDADHAPAFVVVGPGPRVGDDERVVDEAGECVAEEGSMQDDGCIEAGTMGGIPTIGSSRVTTVASVRPPRISPPKYELSMT